MDASIPAAVSFFETNADDILSPTVVPTGIAALDGLLNGGFRQGGLTVLAAGTAAGKSSLACQMACGAAAFAAKEGLGPVVFISYESSASNLARKMMAQTADLRDGFSFASGVSERDRPVAREALARLAKLPIEIEQRCDATVESVSAAIDRNAKKPSLVVIDYLGLMGEAGEAGKADLGDKVEALKVLAMDKSVAILLIAQLSRNADRPDALPTLRDVAVAAITQHADAIMLLHRPSAFRPSSQIERPDYVEEESTLIVAKNRLGPTGEIKIAWDAPRMRFEFGGPTMLVPNAPCTRSDSGARGAAQEA